MREADCNVTKAMLPAATRIGSLLKKKVSLDFVLPGFLAGTVGALISPGGVGKSYWSLELALDLAGAVKGKTSLTGMDLKSGRVVLLCAEDPQDILATRLQAIEASFKGKVSLLDDKSDRPFIDHRDCVGLGVDLLEQSWFEQLCAICMGARLVILDTLRRFHTLDENSTQDMTKVLGQLEQLAKRTGASVLFLHHTSKAAVLNGQATLQQAARGASVLVDNARWVSFLAVMTEVEARQYGIHVGECGSYVRWNVSKQNYGSALDDCWYRRDEGGVLIPVLLKRSGVVGVDGVDGSMHTHGHPGAAARKDASANEDLAADVPPAPDRGRAHLPEPDAQVLSDSGTSMPTIERQVRRAPIPSAKNAFGGNW